MLLEKAILKIAQRHTEERCLLNAGQFGFCAHHSTTLQCMRSTDITLNFNNNMSTAAVFFNTEAAFDTTWHLGLLHKLEADTYLLQLQFLQNKVLRTTGNFPRCTLISNMHMDFNVRYVYSNTKKVSRQQAEVIQNHENEHVRSKGQGEARHRKYKRLKLGGGQSYDSSSY
jgi:hypothetical protein